jgi:hypothetical protein
MGVGQFSSRFCHGLTLGEPWGKKIVAPLDVHKWVVSLAPLEGVGGVAPVEVVCGGVGGILGDASGSV